MASARVTAITDRLRKYCFQTSRLCFINVSFDETAHSFGAWIVNWNVNCQSHKRNSNASHNLRRSIGDLKVRQVASMPLQDTPCSSVVLGPSPWMSAGDFRFLERQGPTSKRSLTWFSDSFFDHRSTTRMYNFHIRSVHLNTPYLRHETSS